MDEHRVWTLQTARSRLFLPPPPSPRPPPAFWAFAQEGPSEQDAHPSPANWTLPRLPEGLQEPGRPGLPPLPARPSPHLQPHKRTGSTTSHAELLSSLQPLSRAQALIHVPPSSWHTVPLPTCPIASSRDADFTETAPASGGQAWLGCPPSVHPHLSTYRPALTECMLVFIQHQESANSKGRAFLSTPLHGPAYQAAPYSQCNFLR